MAAQQFCLKWNNHTNNMLEIFNTLLSTEALVDVTLACDGLSLKAHKIVLSACSPFFQSLFLENPCQHPIVIMKDIPYKDLKAIVDFMYRGEVNVSQDQLSGLLRTAETLKVKGLADENRGVQQEVSTSQNSVVPPSTSTSTSQQRRADSPPLHAKRKKGRPRKRSLSDSNRSDDEMGPAKIKEPNSPEIEELSEDAILDEGRSDSMIRQRSSSSQRRIRSSVNTSFSSKSLTPSNAHIEEPPSGEEEFELEPSKLLEQTLTTDAASSVSNTALTSTMPVNFNLPSSSGIEISQIGSDSQALVPVAGTSDSSHLQGPDSPPDIKPTITTFDESQSDSMMYMDQSSLPGPSNYQDNSMMQGDEQPQGESVIFYECTPEGVQVLHDVSGQVYSVVEVSEDGTLQSIAGKKNVSIVAQGEEESQTSQTDESGGIIGLQAVSVFNKDEDSIEAAQAVASIAAEYESYEETESSDVPIVLVDNGPYDDVCRICKARFNNPVETKRHVNIFHPSEYVPLCYRCSVCPYKSKKKADTVRHMLRHTDKRPFQCDICEKKFKDKATLKSHMIVHSTDREKKNECTVCHKKFLHSSSLRAHLLIHVNGPESHLCQYCAKTFTSKHSLWQHEQIHRGVHRQRRKKNEICNQKN